MYVLDVGDFEDQTAENLPQRRVEIAELLVCISNWLCTMTKTWAWESGLSVAMGHKGIFIPRVQGRRNLITQGLFFTAGEWKQLVSSLSMHGLTPLIS